MKRRGAGTISAADVGDRVRLQAWVRRRRDLGGLIFLQLRDYSGVVQVVVRPDEQPEVAKSLDAVRLEWVVDVEGVVENRTPENINPEMATGEIEVILEGAEILSRSEPLPFAVDGEVDATEETRLRYRFLDLRRQELQSNLRLRHKVTLEVLEHFDERGFINVETPILTRSTPEGARDYLVPSRVHPRSFYALPQSPQLFKQILMVSGLDRYVQIARCFRDEDLRADRQPEFTQVDVEMSFPTEDEIFELIESLFARIFPIAGIEPEVPFPRMTYEEAMRRFGTDRPDLRFGLEIGDLTSLLADSEFRGFRQTAADGGVIRGIKVPAAAGSSRRLIDGWAQLARDHGAAGVLTLKMTDGELQFQVKGVLSQEEMGAVAERLGIADGDLGLIVAGPSSVASAALGAVRLSAAREFDLVPVGEHAFVWVTEFPLLEWDEDSQRWYACHHPFTSPDPRDIDRLETDPGSVRSRAYDVVMNGLELGGGSIRIHDSDAQQRAFAALGIGAEEARERFGFLLEALRYGAPPHGGLALGLDRIIMVMAGASSIRDVIAFPKTTSATCLMTEAPSPVDAAQLAELGIAPADAGESKEPEEQPEDPES